MNNYTRELALNIPASEIYAAITTKKGLGNWWTKDVEIYLHIGGIVTFNFDEKTNTVMKIAKLVPDKEVVWKCVEQNTPDTSPENPGTWIGTTIRFSILDDLKGNSLLNFVHEGFAEETTSPPDLKIVWDNYLESLEKYLAGGVN